MFESEVITTLSIKGVKRYLHKRFDFPFHFHSQNDGCAQSEIHTLHVSGKSFKDKNSTGESAAKPVSGVSF